MTVKNWFCDVFAPANSLKLLTHPFVAGIVIECVLVGLFLLFPVGPCEASYIGIGVLCVHLPAVFLVAGLGIGESSVQLAAAPLLMLPFWIGLVWLLRFIARSRT